MLQLIRQVSAGPERRTRAGGPGPFRRRSPPTRVAAFGRGPRILDPPPAHATILPDHSGTTENYSSPCPSGLGLLTDDGSALLKCCCVYFHDDMALNCVFNIRILPTDFYPS